MRVETWSLDRDNSLSLSFLKKYLVIWLYPALVVACGI